MRKEWALISLALLLMLALPGSAQASHGKSLRYGGGGQGTVLFDGTLHAGKGYVCNDCHLQLFVTKKQARIRMGDHFTDTSCFKCHDNKTAPRDCATCHRKVPSNYLSSSDAMGVMQTTPLPDSADREVILSGKMGATAQSRACLSCHSDPELKAHTERGKGLKLLIAPDMYQSATHGNISCATCHLGTEAETSFTQVPHKILRPTPATCQTCHSVRLSGQIQEFSQSAHAKKQPDKITCASCHDPHAIVKNPVNEPYRLAAASLNKQCLACHDNPERFRQISGRELVATGMAHSFLVKWDKHEESVRCVECHTPVVGYQPHNVQERALSLRDCSLCHIPTDSLVFARADMKEGGHVEAFKSSYIPATRSNAGLDQLGMYGLLTIAGLLLLHGLGRALGKSHGPTGKIVSEYLYPGFVRLCHGINALLFLVLAWTGLGIRFESLPLTLGLEAGTKIHNVSGILLSANFMVYIVLYLVTGQIRQFFPRLDGLGSRLSLQTRYYLYGIFKGEAHPFATTSDNRFNPLQQLTYLLVFVVGMPLLILSGMLLLFADTASPDVTRGCLAWFHYLIAICFVFFLIGHVYLGSTGVTSSSLFRSMITGLHERKQEVEKEQEQETTESDNKE